MDTKTPDVKTEEQSSSTSKTDVKALDSIVDSVMSKTEDSSTEVKTETEEKDDSSESAVLKKNDTKDEASDQEVTAKEKDVEEQEEVEGTEKVEESEEDKAKPKTEEAIPYERFKQVNDELTTLRPAAAEYTQLVNHCKQNNISPDQFSEAFEVMALINKNPEKALERFQQYVEQLNVTLGKGLPADLQTEVTEGTLSKERATEIAQARIQQQAAGRQAQSYEQQQAQVQEQQILSTFQTWLGSKQSLNPSFKPKATNAKDGVFEDFLITNSGMVAAEQQKGKRLSASDLTSIADKAYQRTIEMAQRYTPKIAKKVFRPSSNGQRSFEPKKPSSVNDVIAAVAAKHKLG